MTPEQAAWVRDHVLPPITRRAHRPDTDHLCACQREPAYHCEGGRHQECPGVPDWPLGGVMPETHLLDPRGNIRYGSTATRVWVVGCCGLWRCSCHCHTTPRPGQTALDLETA